MEILSRFEAAQRLTVIAMVVVTTLVVGRTAIGIFTTPKFTVVLCGAVLLLACGLGATLLSGRATLPWGPLGVACALFVVGLGVGVTSAGVRWVAIIGMHGRFTGALAYLAYTVVLLVAARRFAGDEGRWIAYAVLGTAVAVAAYGVLREVIGGESYTSDLGVTGLGSTLGNPNFASAYLALGVPLVVWLFLVSRDTMVRVALGAGAALLIFALAAATSEQGPVAAVAGTSVVAVAWARAAGGRWRRSAFPAWLAIAVLGLLVAVPSLFGAGPLGAIGAQRSVELRRYYWSSAVEMFKTSPLTGIGIDQYEFFYRQVRPVQAARILELDVSSDAPHSVPLAMFANGGVILGVAYLLLVAVTAMYLVRGLREASGGRLLLLGGLGGAWLAYQVQSLVSIDLPALPLTHFALAGAIIGASGRAPFRIFQVLAPSAPVGKKKRTTADRKRTQRRARLAVVAAVTAGVLGLVPATHLYRAEREAAEGTRALRRDDIDTGVERLRRATAMAPRETTYAFELAKGLVRQDEPEQALEVLTDIVEQRPRAFAPTMSIGRTAASLDRTEEARRYYQRALELEPHHPELKFEVAQFALKTGDREWTRELLEQAVATDPDHDAARQALANLDEVENSDDPSG